MQVSCSWDALSDTGSKITRALATCRGQNIGAWNDESRCRKKVDADTTHDGWAMVSLLLSRLSIIPHAYLCSFRLSAPAAASFSIQLSCLLRTTPETQKTNMMSMQLETAAASKVLIERDKQTTKHGLPLLSSTESGMERTALASPRDCSASVYLLI